MPVVAILLHKGSNTTRSTIMALQVARLSNHRLVMVDRPEGQLVSLVIRETTNHLSLARHIFDSTNASAC